MEKVKLTREQAEAIEELLKLRTKESIAREKANPFSLISGYINESSRLVFKDMAFDTLIKALYIGYEVEEAFEVEDWVVHENFGSGFGSGRRNIITKITRIENKDKIYGMWTYIDDGEPMAYFETYSNAERCRHATPEEIAEEKQRRWWAKHGREVWELRKGDVIHKLCSPFEFEAWEITDMDDHYIYAKDSRLINPKTTQMDANYKVICFAEDRKDNA